MDGLLKAKKGLLYEPTLKLERENESWFASKALEDLRKQENESLKKWIDESHIINDFQRVFVSFLNSDRHFLPRNPYPELVKRLRHVEVKHRWKKCLKVLNEVTEEIESKRAPLKLMDSEHRIFGQSVFRMELPAHQNDSDIIYDADGSLVTSNQLRYVRRRKIEQLSKISNLGRKRKNKGNVGHFLNQNTTKKKKSTDKKGSGKEGNDQNEEEEEVENEDDKEYVWGFEHVCVSVTSGLWLTITKQILSSLCPKIKINSSKKRVRKATVVSAPLFFSDDKSVLKKLSQTDSVHFGHLHSDDHLVGLIASLNRSGYEGLTSEDTLLNGLNGDNHHHLIPHSLIITEFDLYNHISICSHSFEIAITEFANVIQRNIYWIGKESRKYRRKRDSNNNTYNSHSHSQSSLSMNNIDPNLLLFYYFKELKIFGHNGQVLSKWRYSDIFNSGDSSSQKNSSLRFQKAVKSATIQKHTIMMNLFVIIGNSSIFETNIHWIFYFRRPPLGINDLSVDDNDEIEAANPNEFDNVDHWAPFALDPFHSIFHGFFFDEQELIHFSHLYCGFQMTHREFVNNFANWQLSEWRMILNNLNSLDYGSVLASLFRLACLAGSETVQLNYHDKKKKKKQKKDNKEDSDDEEHHGDIGKEAKSMMDEYQQQYRKVQKEEKKANSKLRKLFGIGQQKKEKQLKKKQDNNNDDSTNIEMGDQRETNDQEEEEEEVEESGKKRRRMSVFVDSNSAATAAAAAKTKKDKSGNQKRKSQDISKKRRSVDAVEEYRDNAITELRMLTYSLGGLFQGFIDTMRYIHQILEIELDFLKQQYILDHSTMNIGGNRLGTAAAAGIGSSSLTFDYHAEWRLTRAVLENTISWVQNRMNWVQSVEQPQCSELLPLLPRLCYLVSNLYQVFHDEHGLIDIDKFLNEKILSDSSLDQSKMKQWRKSHNINNSSLMKKNSMTNNNNNTQVEGGGSSSSQLGYTSVINDIMRESEYLFDILGDVLLNDELQMCNHLKQWISERRRFTGIEVSKIDYSPLSEVMVLNDAFYRNHIRQKLPKYLNETGTLLQYCVDTELDTWFHLLLFRLFTCNLRLINPFVNVVVNTQHQSLKFDSLKITDQQILLAFLNLNQSCLKYNNHGYFTLFPSYHIYGMKSSLLLLNPIKVDQTMKLILSQFPIKEYEIKNLLFMGNHHSSIIDHNTRLTIDWFFIGEMLLYDRFVTKLKTLDLVNIIYAKNSRVHQASTAFSNYSIALVRWIIQSQKNLFLSLNIKQNNHNNSKILYRFIHEDFMVSEKLEKVQLKLMDAVQYRYSVDIEMLLCLDNVNDNMNDNDNDGDISDGQSSQPMMTQRSNKNNNSTHRNRNKNGKLSDRSSNNSSHLSIDGEAERFEDFEPYTWTNIQLLCVFIDSNTGLFRPNWTERPDLVYSSVHIKPESIVRLCVASGVRCLDDDNNDDDDDEDDDQSSDNDNERRGGMKNSTSFSSANLNKKRRRKKERTMNKKRRKSETFADKQPLLNLHYINLCRELFELQKQSLVFLAYLVLVQIKALLNDQNGIVELVRFYAVDTLPGLVFETTRRVEHSAKILQCCVQSRSLAKRIDRNRLHRQLKSAVQYCQEIFFCDQLTFLDRIMLHYVEHLQEVGQVINVHSEDLNLPRLLEAFKTMHAKLYPMLHATSNTWAASLNEHGALDVDFEEEDLI